MEALQKLDTIQSESACQQDEKDKIIEELKKQLHEKDFKIQTLTQQNNELLQGSQQDMQIQELQNEHAQYKQTTDIKIKQLEEKLTQHSLTTKGSALNTLSNTLIDIVQLKKTIGNLPLDDKSIGTQALSQVQQIENKIRAEVIKRHHSPNR